VGFGGTGAGVSARDDGAPVDLDAWRAEAGACAPLDAAATRGPWRSTWGDDEGADAERGKRGEEVTIEAVGLEGLARIVLGVTWYDGPHPCCREEDAAFIEAARDGWPRDAARVARLADRCAALETLIAAWRKLAFAINTRRLSEGVAEGDEAAAIEEAHHRAWAEVQRVDPEWRAAARKASK